VPPRGDDLASDTACELARARTAFVKVLARLGRREQAGKAWRELEPLLRKLVHTAPARPEEARQLADALARLAGATAADGGPVAEGAFRAAVSLLERLRAARGAADSRGDLVRTLAQQGDFSRRHQRTEEATRAYRRAVQVGEELVAEAPTPVHRSLLALCANNLGAQLARASPGEAWRLLKRAGELAEQLAAEYPSHAPYRRLLAANLTGQGNWLVRAGRLPEAEATLRRLVPLRRRLLGESPTDEAYRRNLRADLQALARLIRERHPEEAERLLSEAAALGK
jgi:hypothetical protein